MQKISNNTKGILYACTTALFWGFLSIALKVAVQKVDAYTICWFRFTMAFLVLWVYYMIADRSQFYILKRPPFILLVAALCLGINYIGFLKGLEFTSPAVAQIFIQIGPIMLAVAGIIIFRERIIALQIFGFIIAGIGLYFFYNEQLKLFVNNPEMLNRGVLWVILAAGAWLTYAVLQKKLVVKHPANTLNMVIYGLPALLFLPLADFSIFPELGFYDWLLMVFLGANTLIAYGCLALAFKYTEAYKVSIIITMNPLITLIAMSILSYLAVSWIAPERFTLVMIIGALLELGGAALAIYFAQKKKKKSG